MTLTRSQSHCSAPAIRSSAKNDNIQIIAVRSGGNECKKLQHSNSTAAASASLRTRSNSPCVSKILINGSKSLSSASFSGPRLNTSTSQQQPASLPVISNAVKRSRSVSGSESDRSKVQVFQLEQHCKNLEGELDHVKDEILKILSDKSTKSKENESLKHYVKAFEELRVENEGLRKELALLKISNPPKSPALSTSSKSSAGSDTQNIDRSSPDGQEFDQLDSTSTNVSSCSRQLESDHSQLEESSLKKELEVAVEESKLAKKELDKVRSELERLKQQEEVKEKEEEETKVETEKAPVRVGTLTSKCKDLEESLELMQKEFENMEDYWQVR